MTFEEKMKMVGQLGKASSGVVIGALMAFHMHLGHIEKMQMGKDSDGTIAMMLQRQTEGIEEIAKTVEMISHTYRGD